MMKRFLCVVAAVTMTLSLAACNEEKGETNSSLADSSSDASPFFDAQTGGEDGNGNGNGNSDSSATAPQDCAELLPRVSDKASNKDIDDSFDRETATVVSLSDSGVSITGEGAVYENGDVVVSTGGTYILEGKLSDGRIVVNGDDEADVKLVLCGVEIKSESSCSIYVKNADNTVITLAEGTENILSDASQYTYDDAENEEPNACIFSKDDLAINGTGSLTVNANFHNGIVSKDDLVLVGGNVSVNAVNVGLKGNDSVTVLGGSYKVTSGADSLKASTADEADKGWIVIEGGKLDLTSGQDAVSAETDLTITGGEISVTTTGEVQPSGNDMGGPGWWEESDETDSSTDISSKGIKSGTTMYIGGGVINAQTTDHTVHATGSAVICGGTVSIASSVGKGISVHGNLLISDGQIDVTNATEGIESKAILTISGGEINIKATDDGLNAGGSGGMMMGGWQQDYVQDDAELQATHLIVISGGEIYIDAGGDGIDSNGDLEISGGNVVVAGPTNNGNGFLDCGDNRNEIRISGGSLIAGGSVGMVELPSDASAQNSVIAMVNASAGQTVSLRNSSGETLLSIQTPKQMQGVLFSCKELTQGESVSVYVDDTLVGTAEITSGIAQIGEGSFGEGFGDFGGMGGHGGGGKQPPDGFDGGKPGMMW